MNHQGHQAKKGNGPYRVTDFIFVGLDHWTRRHDGGITANRRPHRDQRSQAGRQRPPSRDTLNDDNCSGDTQNDEEIAKAVQAALENDEDVSAAAAKEDSKLAESMDPWKEAENEWASVPERELK